MVRSCFTGIHKKKEKDVNIVDCIKCNLFTLCKPHETNPWALPRCRLTVLDELDCSFNELEALPSSIGQCTCIRTFAADHNFLVQLPPEVSVRARAVHTAAAWVWADGAHTVGNCCGPCLLSFTFALLQMGNWTNATVLFLHSNKLESLPEEMGDMQKLKVINLSNNKWVFRNNYQSMALHVKYLVFFKFSQLLV